MKKLLLILLLLPISLFSQKAGLITNSVYNIDTYIIVTNDKLVAKLFVNGIIDNVADDKDFENEAMTFYQEGLPLVVWFKPLKLNSDDMATVTHEVSHVVTYMLGYVGIPLSDDTCEVYAYLTEYYSRNFYKIIYGRNKYYVLPD